MLDGQIINLVQRGLVEWRQTLLGVVYAFIMGEGQSYFPIFKQHGQPLSQSMIAQRLQEVLGVRGDAFLHDAWGDVSAYMPLVI